MALKEAWQTCLEIKPDKVVFLGDLFTYGHRPVQVMQLIVQFQNAFSCEFIIGNHDQVYLDYFSHTPGEWSDYYRRLPDWLKASFEWTLAQLDEPTINVFLNLPWQYEFIYQGVLFSHANPFGRADWRYLNSQTDFEEGLAVLEHKNYNLGLFGHTHRHKICQKDFGRELRTGRFLETSANYDFSLYSLTLATLASLGQSRDSTQASYIYSLNVDSSRYLLKSLRVNYDSEAYKLGLVTALSNQPDLLTRIISYY